LCNTITIGEKCVAEGKSTVHLKISIGNVNFEIECNVKEIRDVVDNVLAAVAASSISGNLPNIGMSSTTVPSRGETCKSIILDLWEEGWFDTGRSLSDVHGEMGRRGFHYDRTAVAHALVDLVREGMLTRIGKPRRYQYLQKRPPPKKVGARNE